MSQSVPDFTTVIVVISFLLVLGVVAFIVKKKSGHLKKIIKKENSFDVMHQMPLNNGFLAYVFKVDDEKFFFIGHKSGRGSLTQIDQPKLKIRDLLRLNEGSVVELERLAGDPLDILANGVKIAKGEVVMVGERFGIRFTEVTNPENRVQKL